MKDLEKNKNNNYLKINFYLPSPAMISLLVWTKKLFCGLLTALSYRYEGHEISLGLKCLKAAMCSLKEIV